MSSNEEATSSWPKAAHTVGNAGVMLVGCSSEHGGVPCVILGGRLYKKANQYKYTDFGGGVDRKKGETPQQGAFREFAEELFSKTEDEAKAMAHDLCTNSLPLVGGKPFVHNNAYAMFVVTADAIAEAMGLAVPKGQSAMDYVFSSATENSELTSVALVSVEELLRAALADGIAHPLNVRQLDGDETRSCDEIKLRELLVGPRGSINTIRDALENPMAMVTKSCKSMSPSGYPDVSEKSSSSKAKRWRNSKKGDNDPADITCDATLRKSEQKEIKCRSQNTTRLRSFVFDMETGDPDDVLTLLFLASHPDVDLRAVTITPGTEEQVALVRWLLQQLNLEHVRLGAQRWPDNATKPVKLTTQFYRSFGRSPHGKPECERADQVLLDCCDENVTLVTGAPLHNLGDALQLDGFKLGLLVAQGGFAGEGVVPAEMQMDKFKGMLTCPTWNFGGNIKAAEAALASTCIGRKICVSKNVCHSVVYDEDWHRALQVAAEAKSREDPHSRSAIALNMMHRTMDEYLRHKPGGKKLHDPLALAVALNEAVCELVEVELFCQKGKWGSRLSPGSNIWISIAYDAAAFLATLLA